MEENNINNRDFNASDEALGNSNDPPCEEPKEAVAETAEVFEVESSQEVLPSPEDDSVEVLDSAEELEAISEEKAPDTECAVVELESDEIVPVSPSAYTFRWDYDEQRRHDEETKKKNSPNKGVATYIVILAVTFVLAAAILLATVFLGSSFSASTPQATAPMQYSDSLALDALYEYCLPSYVAINIVKEGGSEGVGSGIVITEDGYICTNYHVVEDAKKITVVTHTGKKISAEYIDGDEINDIAVIKVSGHKLSPAKLGSSSTTKVGERVMAIGTPYSISYAGSMTAGYVSGIDRQYAVKNDNGTVNKILRLIQTDTSVNPGNSGGPLYNMNGEVIGVVTLKIAGSNYEGMGFVLPIDGVKGMIFDIIENGKLTDTEAGSATRGAALGISGHAIIENVKYLMTDTYCIEVQTDEEGDYIEWSSNGYYTQKIYVTDTETLEAAGLENAYPFTSPCTGVLVKSTSEGFDSSVKLQVEDIIISANDVVCDSMSVLQELIFNCRVGDVLTLEVFRNGTFIIVEVELGEANSMG